MDRAIVHGVKERPILFNGPMVRALVGGSKTQTRRIVKPDPGPYWNPVVGPYNPIVVGNGGYEAPGPEIFGASDESQGRKCPYGQPGDRLWCRETWQALHKYNSTKISDIPEADRHWVNYPADGNTWDARQRAARFMPRWASRILLEITSVRVERLNDCSNGDAISEGIALLNGRYTFNGGMHESRVAIDAYMALWESLNGTGSWDANPWVWCIEFRRIGGAA